MSAIHYLTELNGSKKRILEDAPEQIISGTWKRLVYDKNDRKLLQGAEWQAQRIPVCRALGHLPPETYRKQLENSNQVCLR